MLDQPEQVTDQQLAERMQQLEGMLRDLESRDESVTEPVREIVQTLLEFHGAALARIVFQLERSEAGSAALQALAGDELVRNVLLLHDLHPQDLASRVVRALDEVRPLLAGHGGSVELLECSESGGVRLRLEGNCHGCPSLQQTLRQTIEASLYAAAPDITCLEVEGLATDPPAAGLPAGFVPLGALELSVGVVPTVRSPVQQRSN